MPYKRLSEITNEEYEERIIKLKKIMIKQKLDVIFLTEEVNIRWISGYWVMTMEDGWMPTVVIIPYSDKHL